MWLSVLSLQEFILQWNIQSVECTVLFFKKWAIKTLQVRKPKFFPKKAQSLLDFWGSSSLKIVRVRGAVTSLEQGK